MNAPRITAEEIAAYRKEYSTAIYAGHTVSHINRILDALESAWAANRILDEAAKDAQAFAYQAQEARAELDRLHADGMPRDREELQKLLNDAYRKGNQEAHEAHRLVREMGLSAQGGEVPEIQQPNDVDWIQLKRDAEAYGLDWGEGFYQGLAYSNKWLRVHSRPAPPHPDTVEASKVDRDRKIRGWDDYRETQFNAWERKQSAQAQPATDGGAA